MFQQVRQLLDLITKSVDTLEQACIENKTELPSLDEPFDPAGRALWANPVAAETVAVITAATLHLNAIVSRPHAIMRNIVNGVSPLTYAIVRIKAEDNKVFEVDCRPHVPRGERNRDSS